MGLKLVIKQEHNLIAYCNAMIMRWAKASVNIIKLGWIDTKTNFADFNKVVVLTKVIREIIWQLGLFNMNNVIINIGHIL